MLPDQPAPPIVLTTDFGVADPYVGVMKGVIHGINPRAVVIDLTHQVPPQDLRRAGFLLATSYRYFPSGAIHVVVVDPGVGTQRRALLVTTPTARFLAPDNGILSYVLPRPGGTSQVSSGLHPVPAGCAAYQLTNPDYWLHPVSSTFHGRDIFAPVAAHLSLGVAPEVLGTPVADLVWLPSLQPARVGSAILGEVLYADHFGNLITNISAEDLTGLPVSHVEIKRRSIPRLSRTFHDRGTPAGSLVAFFGSHGYLEIALPDGSAAAELGVGAGEEVRVSVA